MTDRRGFLAAMAALGGEVLLGWRPRTAQLRVEATPTVFYAPPDGRSVLVRFVAAGTSAAGGRLRVFDRARRQLGTAGMIGIGGTLYGELWLPFERETEFFTDLELPGVRGVVRTPHRLRPRPRWTIYWATVADTRTITAELEASDPLLTNATALALRESGVLVNPVPDVPAAPALPAQFLDHGAFLRLLTPAADLEARYGVPVTPLALDTTGLVGRLASTPLMFEGSGIRWVAVRGVHQRPVFRVESPDGSAVTAIALAGGGSPGELGFPHGGDAMARGLQRWLDSLTPLAGDDRAGLALVLGTDLDEGRRAAVHVAGWNSRFAYPRIVSGRLSELLGRLEREPVMVQTHDGRRTTHGDGPAAGDRNIADLRESGQRLRVGLAIAPLVARLSGGTRGLAALAEQFAFRVPGTLVFNPTPFARSDLAVMPDGTERLVTDVPAMGYACIPYPGYVQDDRGRPKTAEDGRWTEIPGSENEISIEERYFTVRLDLETGAIRSLVGRANGREWVRPRSSGLNDAPGFRLGPLMKFRNPGTGMRIVAERRGPAGAILRSSVTVYAELPWVDIVNQVDQDRGAPESLGFAFGLERPAVAWEIPAGHEAGPAPVARLVHLRWLTLAAGEDMLFFRGLDAPAAAVGEDGTLRSVDLPSRTRYRLAFASGFTAPEDPWRFGWGTESLVTAPVPGTGRAALPSFGSLIVVDQPGIAMLELRPARDGDGMVIYLQELLGAARDITLGPGVLGFRGGRRIDFLERELGALPNVGERGVALPIRAYGVAAVRLTGVELAGG